MPINWAPQKQCTHPQPQINAKKAIEAIRNPKYPEKLVIDREVSRIKSKPKPKSSKLEIKVQKPYSNMISMSMDTIGLDLYVKSIQ